MKNSCRSGFIPRFSDFLLSIYFNRGINLLLQNGFDDAYRRIVIDMAVIGTQCLSLVKRFVRILFGMLLLAVLVGCETTTQLTDDEKAQQRKAELAHKEDYLERIQSVEEACYETLHVLGETVAEYNEKESLGYSGAVFATKRFYPMDIEEVVDPSFLGDFVAVRYIVEDSPADRGGLLLGDRLLLINGQKVPKGERATSFIADRLRKLWRLDEANQLLVARNGEELVLEIEAEESVHYSVIVTPFLTDGIYAEGKTLYFSLKTMEGLEGNEFDYLCAFALVQNVMKHAKMKEQNAFFGGMLDMAAMFYGVNTGGIFGSMGRSAHQAGFLIESDLLALYSLARAGFDISGYPDFWEASLSDEEKGIDRQSQKRLDAMRQIVAEIEAKRLGGEPIYPTEYLSGDWSLDDLNLDSE